MQPPFDSALIQQQWLPFEQADANRFSAPAMRYQRYYGLDFERSLSDIKHRFGYLDSTGYRIACHSWQPSNANGTVLITHGYFDHVGIYRHFIRFFLEQGLAVFAYDQPGHGLSDGSRASIKHFADYQGVLNNCLGQLDTLPGPHFSLAQSMGGAILLDYLLHTSTPVFNNVWLLAPLVWPTGWDTKKYLHASLRYFIGHIRRNFAVNSHDLRFLNFLEHKDPLQPRQIAVTWVTAWKQWLPGILSAAPNPFPADIFQGTGDTSVDWEKNLPVLKEKLPNSNVHLLEGARHQLVNETHPYRQTIFDVISQQLANN